MNKVIVTGANGFIGTALCKELSSRGVETIAVIRDESEDISQIADLHGIKIVYCDLCDFGDLDKKIPDRDVDVIYHLAWVGSAGTLRGNDDVQINNIKYTCETVKAASRLECKKFVFASSIMEYEIGALMATDETPAINTLYSSAKVAADYMARTVAGSLKIEFIRAVISNIYGPGETSPRLINTSIRKMLNGEHCSFSPGEQIYDFIYITDATRIFVALGEKGKNNRTYYIGSQNPRPLKEFLIEMRNQVDPSIELGIGDFEFNGISLSYREFDINSVQRDTGVTPVVSFADGIKNTIKWIKDN